MEFDKRQYQCDGMRCQTGWNEIKLMIEVRSNEVEFGNRGKIECGGMLMSDRMK